MSIDAYIHALVAYGEKNKLFEPSDRVFITNRILEILRLDSIEKVAPANYETIEDLLNKIMNECFNSQVLIKNDNTHRDLLDSAIMGALMPRPSEVISRFKEEYKISPESATDYFYKLSIDANYIRKSRTDQNLSWSYNSKYGALQITVNLSKPEKDIKEIEAEKNAPPKGYPKCLLCRENEGYSGRINHPARQNLRLIPFKLGFEEWYMQYSPYLYYNEHCILLSEKHQPMAINRHTFEKMMDFLKVLPHYFVGSNADLPIVGGSILSHDHFQGGKHIFPMTKAESIRFFDHKNYHGVKASWIHWPLSVIRLKSKSSEKLIEASSHILNVWRNYSDSSAAISAFTEDTPHNTITPIARMNEGFFEIDLVLRNNITTDEFPLGLYHPHEEVHAIKKENIGLIEVMGLAILPPRLKEEIQDMLGYLNGQTLKHDKHKSMLDEIKDHANATNDNTLAIKNAIGKKFELALEHAGVFFGKEASFLKFMDELGWQERGE